MNKKDKKRFRRFERLVCMQQKMITALYGMTALNLVSRIAQQPRKHGYKSGGFVRFDSADEPSK